MSAGETDEQYQLDAVDAVAAQLGHWPSTATISAKIGYRGGAVVLTPRVSDFSVSAVVNGPMERAPEVTGEASVLASGGLRVLLGQLAVEVGHQMLWWPSDAAELRRPVMWPAGLGGPRLPLRRWSVRPTPENVAMWMAGWLEARLAQHIAPGWSLVALELRIDENLAAVIRGIDIPLCAGFPGPLA